MHLMKALTATAAISALMLPAQSHAGGTVEVLHWWTSGGETKAGGTLKEGFEKQGGTWLESPIAGGGGDAAMTGLRARVMAGNPPTAVQRKEPGNQEWADQGGLADVEDVANAGKWDDVLPPSMAAIMKYQGKYAATPSPLSSKQMSRRERYSHSEGRHA